jgi:hypothetical protein
MEGLLDEHGHLAGLRDYLGELKRFSLFRKQELLAFAETFEGIFHYDFERLLESDFSRDPEECRLEKPTRYVFRHNPVQRDMIKAYVRQYGTTVVGLGRILMRAHVKRLFREIQVGGQTIGHGLDKTYRRALNLYGD